MKERYLKARAFKIFVQKQKELTKQRNEFKNISGIELCGYKDKTEIHIYGKKSFDELAKTLNIIPTIDKNWSNNGAQSYFYYEGIKVFVLHSKDITSEKFNYTVNQYRKEFAEILLDEDDKEKAFIMLQEKYKNDKYSKLKYLHGYEDFKKLLNRHSSKRNYESKESIESKYLSYKNNFEEIDEDLSYKEARRIRPNEDWYHPLSFQQWYKINY